MALELDVNQNGKSVDNFFYYVAVIVCLMNSNVLNFLYFVYFCFV